MPCTVRSLFAFSAKLHTLNTYIHADTSTPYSRNWILPRVLDSWNVFNRISINPPIIEDYHRALSKNVALDVIILGVSPIGRRLAGHGNCSKASPHNDLQRAWMNSVI